MVKNIRKISKIPKACNERYLNLTGSGGQRLQRFGINFSGVSRLVPGYENGNPGPSRHHMIIFTQGGKGYLVCRQFELSLLPGAMLVVPAGSGYEFGTQGGEWDILWFYLSDVPAWRYLKQRSVQHEATRLIPRLALAMEGFLLENGAAGTALSPGTLPAQTADLYAELLVKYLTCCLKSQSTGDEHDTHIRLGQVWHQVENRLGESWDVAKLAGLMNTSPSTFQRMVKRFYGTTPWQMVIQLRMAQARQLMRDSGYPLKVIAARLGYADEFVFSSAFRQHWGVCPRDYRKGQREVPD